MQIKPLIPTLLHIPLRNILVIPEITPKYLQVEHIKSDKVIEEAYYRLMTELGYREPLKVGFLNGAYTLLSSYEVYCAYLDLHAGKLDHPVDCIVLQCTSDLEMKRLAIFLSQFSSAKESHLNRLVNLDLLRLCGLKSGELRELMGIKARTAADKRQLQRDLRLIKQPQLFGRILGIEVPNPNDRKKAVGFLSSILEVKTFRADMTVKHAEGYLSKLRDDPALIDKFLEIFDEEKEKQRKLAMTAEEEKKPFYLWRSFSYTQMLRIAESIAVSGGYPRRDSDEKADQGWNIYYNDVTDDFHLPQTTVNLSDPSPKNFKKMFSIAYRAEKLAQTLWAQIDRVCPAKHGASLKTFDIVISSNKPKFEDQEYLNKIRQYRSILFCERDLIFKVLKLKPNDFGFDSYRFDSISTYEKAFKQYHLWWCKVFLRKVVKEHFNKTENHPHFQVYRHIKDFLGIHKCNSKRIISLADFFNEIFAYVMREIDSDRKVRKLREESLYEITAKVKSHNWKDIDDALRKCGKVTLTKDQLDSIIKDRIADKEDSYAKNFEQVAKSIELLTSHPSEIGQRQRDHSPLTLKDIALVGKETP